MKKTVVVICILVAAIATQAQQVSAEQAARISDSLNKVLVVTTNPPQRFSIINQLLLNENGFSGRIDSALCIQQLQIAEKLFGNSKYFCII